LSSIAGSEKGIQDIVERMLSNDPKERPAAAWLVEWGRQNQRSQALKIESPTDIL
jgi:serine/threonine protein kinase